MLPKYYSVLPILYQLKNLTYDEIILAIFHLKQELGYHDDFHYLTHCKYVLIRLKLIEPSSSIKDRDTYVTLSQQKGSYV
ncbi:MAG: hypothetical protein B6I37_04480 [Desulfobacteraceae bacterium 4572_35.2]|nr:MAG: hypothetical protein B6I37_04480 [Desulfobacteraceae bacterium 4572_35.2]